MLRRREFGSVPLFAAGARLLPAIETALPGSVEAPL
jgi:hypothetical protein